MKIVARTREEYLAKVGEREPDVRQLDELIQKHAPDLKPTVGGGMYGNMLAYGMMPYKPKSAKEWTEWPLVMLGAQKNHLALYVCAVDPDGKYVAEKYESKLGNVSCGKSCIRFKKFEDLNLETIEEMLGSLNQRYKSGEKLYG